MIFHVIYLILVHQVSIQSDAFDGGKTHFYKENMIGSIAFNFEVICDKTFLNLLNLSLGFSRDGAPPNFTTIQDNESDKSLKNELPFIPHH